MKTTNSANCTLWNARVLKTSNSENSKRWLNSEKRKLWAPKILETQNYERPQIMDAFKDAERWILHCLDTFKDAAAQTVSWIEVFSVGAGALTNSIEFIVKGHVGKQECETRSYSELLGSFHGSCKGLRTYEGLKRGCHKPPTEFWNLQQACRMNFWKLQLYKSSSRNSGPSNLNPQLCPLYVVPQSYTPRDL